MAESQSDRNMSLLGKSFAMQLLALTVLCLSSLSTVEGASQEHPTFAPSFPVRVDRGFL